MLQVGGVRSICGMTTDYDRIAGQYREAKQHPWRHLVEEYSFLRLIGDLRDKKVVDLACGEGFFTRKLKERGAASVTGVDISREMIALARAREAEECLGVEYVVGDARVVGPEEDFDVAVAAWLLVYAHDRTELDAFCRSAARRLKAGGRFVTLTTHPGLYEVGVSDYRKYGFSVALADHAYEGAPVVWTIHLGDSSFDIENYYLPAEAYRSALERAGFRDVAFHELALSPEAAGEREYWDEFFARSPALMIAAIKA